MKLFLAAPESGLPSLLTALDSHASSLHFLMKLVLAAPERGLPSLLTALLAQDSAIAVPIEKEVIRTATKIRFIISSIFCSAVEKIRTCFEKIAVRPHHCGLHEQNSEILEEFRSCSSISSRLRLLVPKLDPGPIRNHPT